MFAFIFSTLITLECPLRGHISDQKPVIFCYLLFSFLFISSFHTDQQNHFNNFFSFLYFKEKKKTSSCKSSIVKFEIRTQRIDVMNVRPKKKEESFFPAKIKVLILSWTSIRIQS